MSDLTSQNNNLANLDDYKAWQDVFTTWLQNYKSERTRRKYRSITTEFFRWADKWFTDVEQMDIIAWREYLETERELPAEAKDGSTSYRKAALSDASVNLYLSAVSSFYNFAIEKKLTDTNPVEGVRRHSVSPYGRATYLNMEKGEDLQLLNNIATDSLKGLRDKAIILLMLTTAVRVGSVANARLNNLLEMNGQWYMDYRNKGGERQMALITAPVMKALRAYLQVRGILNEDAPLFATVIGNAINPNAEEGKPMSATAITNMVSRRAKAAGLHHITAHSLRHSAALQAIKHGSVGDVQKLLKHKSNRVTLIYIDHIEDSKADEMTEKLASRYE